MLSTFVYGVAIVSVVCACVSCQGSVPNVPPLTSSAQQPVATPASKAPSATKQDTDCVANTEQLPLKIFYAPKGDALESAGKEYLADYDEHAEPLWLLKHSKVIDDAFITGTLTEGSAHFPAFDDDRQRFYRRSQWLCQ